MHGRTVYVKYRLPFARDLSLENSADSPLCFRLALLPISVLLSTNHFLCLDAWFLILFHVTQMRFSPSTHLQMCLSLEAYLLW